MAGRRSSAAFEHYKAGLQEFAEDKPEVRVYTDKVLDYFTGDQTTTNWIRAAIDFTTLGYSGVTDVRNVLKTSARTAVTEAQTALTAASGAPSQQLADAAEGAVKNIAESAGRVASPHRIGNIANDIAGGTADVEYVKHLEAVLKKKTGTKIIWRSLEADNHGNHFNWRDNIIHMTTGRTNTPRGVFFEEIQHALDFQTNPNWVKDWLMGGNQRLHAGTFNRLANNTLFDLTHDEMMGFLQQADGWAIASGKYFTWDELGIVGARGAGPTMPTMQR